MFETPEVFDSKARDANAVFSIPVVFAFKAKDPKAVFSFPVLFDVNASYPIAVFLSPVVTASKAVVPRARLYCALAVLDEGSFPMYSELSSTNASVKSLIDVADWRYDIKSDAGIVFIVPPSFIIIPSAFATVIELPIDVPPSNRFNSAAVELTAVPPRFSPAA